MEFGLTSEQQELRETVRRFAREELGEESRRVECEGEPPSDAILKRFAQLGLLGINLPVEFGGAGQSHLDAVLALEQVAAVSPAVAFPVFEANFGPVAAVARLGSPALKKRLLPEVCSGEAIVAVAMSEPNAGTALTDLTTTATARGDWIVVNGTKRWCSGAGHSHYYLVYSRMSETSGAAGIGAVIVEKDRPGVSFGKKEHHMGLRGVPTADIFFDEVEVPAENMVVPAGGFRKLMEAFDLERCGNTTMSLAIAQSAFDYVLPYVQERRQFGKPIVDFQAVQMKIAEMIIRLEASRLLLYRAVVNAAAGLPDVGDSSIAKCFANEMARDVTGTALQLMGGYGYSTQYPLEQKMRDAWAWGIAGGAIDIQKVSIAGAVVGRRFSQR